jgi:hypothetical protein
MKRQSALVTAVGVVVLAVVFGGCSGRAIQDMPDGDEDAVVSDALGDTGRDVDVKDTRDDEDRVTDVEAMEAIDSDADAEDGRGDRRLPTRLRAEGRRILNAEGEPVILKGVNLGGWLFNETWITQIDYSLTSRLHALGHREGIGEAVDAVLVQGSSVWDGAGYLDTFQPALAEKIGAEKAEEFVSLARGYVPTLYDDSDVPLRRKLTERFGEEARDELLDIFQRAWLGEGDIEWLAEQGFNLVRVPMTYRNLTRGPEVDKPTKLVWNESAFQRLNDLLDWCETHSVYAVLDIQEAPGAQNSYAEAAELYTDPAMQELTVQLWQELSRRYRDRDIVAAYSLLAEPFGAPDVQARDTVYDMIVRAIRLLGDDHLLVIHDGFFGMDTLPNPLEMGWEGVIYSTHFFEFSAVSFDKWDFLVNYYFGPILADAQLIQNVPYFIGSFSTRIHADWSYQATRLLVDWYTQSEWSWAVWTYKRIDDPIEKELWGKESCVGLKGRLQGTLDRPDIFDDDLPTLRSKFAAYRDLKIEVNQSLLDAMTGSQEGVGEGR